HSARPLARLGLMSHWTRPLARLRFAGVARGAPGWYRNGVSARDEMVSMGLPRPGKALKWVMGTLLAIWVVLAFLINLLKVNTVILPLLVGNTPAILKFQIWRLFTAGLINHPFGAQGVNHIVTVLLGLYFLGPTLEARWGGRRMILFLIASVVM